MLRFVKLCRGLSSLTVVAVLLSALLSGLVLPVSAEGEKQLTHLTEMPERFRDAEFVEFEDYDDAAGEYFNSIDLDDGSWFDYVYLKKEADIPFLTVSFVVDSSGMYEFLYDIMAYESAVPRSALLQVDDGEKVYCNVTYNDRHLVHEYFTGHTVELPAGVHTLTLYLGDDFDDVNVKSIFFDRFYFIRTGDPENLPIETLPEDTTEAVTDTSSEETTTPSTGKGPDGFIDEPQGGIEDSSSDTIVGDRGDTSDTGADKDNEKSGCGASGGCAGGCSSAVGGLPGLCLLVSAAFIGLKKKT